MARIGREIVQTRTYVDETQKAPNLNYKDSFPITVFDAVRADMEDENSVKLSELLEQIQTSLRGKQPLIPAKPSNYLMTYAGVPGGAGAIAIGTDIPWDPAEQKHDKIPTEKAVANYMMKLGLVDEDGNPIDPDRAKIRYSDVIGRPLIYEGLGNNTDGYIHQKGVTEAFREVDLKYEDLKFQNSNIAEELSKHKLNYDNPHKVSIDQIGAASAEVLNMHMMDFENPHKVTKYQVELDKVDNTSDLDKPISNATQQVLDELKNLLNIIQDEAKGFIVDIGYDQKSGILKVTWHNGSYVNFMIPIDGLVDEIRYNKETKNLEVIELNGEMKEVSLSDLFIRYLGSISSNIQVEIIGNNDTGDQIIKASIVPKGITENEMGDNSVITRVLSDAAVTTEKIHDLSITTDKLDNESVITEKVAIKAITTSRIADRAVNGRTLMSSSIPNRVLVVGDENTDPYFGRIKEAMMDDDSVSERSIIKQSVTSDKLSPWAVTTDKIADLAVTTSKIASKNITNDKMDNGSVDGRVIQTNVHLNGTPTISVRPDTESDGNEIPDTRWTMDRIRRYVNQNHNYGDRSVDGRVLFSSDVRHRILAVLRANSDPVWTQVDEEMMADNSVNTNQLIDRSVARSKIADDAVNCEHIAKDAVESEHIKESAVLLDKIIRSDNANMVLASTTENSHPTYTKVIKEMMAHNSVGSFQIEDRAVTMSKIESSSEPNRVLTVTLKGTSPNWTQVTTPMIADGAVSVDKIKEVQFPDMVLGSLTRGNHPLWTKINGNMISNDEIHANHIAEKEIYGKHIVDNAIDTNHIKEYCITSDLIAPNAVTGAALFMSQYPNRVLGVTDPYSEPLWLQVDSDMIRDEGVKKEKLFRSENPYRVLGSTQAGTPPEYIKITNDFIMDDTIRPGKLVRDFVLYGLPENTGILPEDSDNYQIPNTQWVRKTVANMINDFQPEILFDKIETEMLKDHSVGPTKLFRSPYPGPRVLGVTGPNEDPEYILIENALMVDGSVTTNKLQRNIHLLGSPVLEVRPSPTASQETGEGDLIPDVQWVLDRIAEYGGTGSGGTTPPVSGTFEPADNSVSTRKIQNRAVTGDKLFTSGTSNRVLAVEGANTNPKYTRVNAEMMGDVSVTARTIFKSSNDNRIMGVKTANGNPEWMQVNIGMMGNNSVGTEQIVNLNVTTEKIKNEAITQEKLANTEIITENRIHDNAVTVSKIKDNAVTRSKVADGAIDGSKIVQGVVLKGNPTVESNRNYKTRSLRNIILSPDAPSGGEPGDIWIRYI